MYMRKEGRGLLLLIISLAMLLGSCGGGTSSNPDLNTALDQQALAPQLETVNEKLDGSPADVSGLPALPAGLDPVKGSSALDEAPPSVRGNDYINAANATETDRGLLLQPEGFGLAWALYGIDGLGDYDVVGLDLQAMPLEGAGGYFVAVGNYSNRSWTISGPHDAASKVRLPQDASFISPAGTLYFVVFTVDPLGAVMQSASVILDGNTDRPMRRSHAPWGLEASDGTLDNGIGLHWNAPHRGVVDHYLVFRRLQPDEEAGDDQLERRGFVAIGRTAETRFLDDNARPGVRYFYCVLAVNDAGRSAHSNVDGGWWGQRDGENGLFIIGIASTEDGRPVPGIIVSLAGTDHAPVLTNDDGKFVFRNLESGLYTVHAESGNDRLVVRPANVDVELGDSSVRGIHFIVKRVSDVVD
ncbi:hypothetical protein KDL30_02700 [bacterium]|nr:hypothetical protein [bacterium]